MLTTGHKEEVFLLSDLFLHEILTQYQNVYQLLLLNLKKKLFKLKLILLGPHLLYIRLILKIFRLSFYASNIKTSLIFKYYKHLVRRYKMTETLIQ